MVKTKFTRNGREVMIFGAMRNFNYGGDEAVQESKKGGERDASVSLSSPERSRIRKSVEGISMLASTEASKASKTRRGTSYGSPSPEKATRRGSTLSPRVAKKQKVNVAPSGDDREEWPESEMLASTVAKKTRRGTSYVLRPHPHCSGIPRIPIVFTDESSQPELIMRYSKKER
ncbi:hypothetical protein F2Q69_00026725 [Brassica cretica]|uniref:Uncharacterized protein n=1 Tax=Brassica cretica TaxID=69181 RepID=A0A8S9S441_BRACR|nr:hypothetical protein F2Q69_00026725 [Brassica cretica]